MKFLASSEQGTQFLFYWTPQIREPHLLMRVRLHETIILIGQVNNFLKSVGNFSKSMKRDIKCLSCWGNRRRKENIKGKLYLQISSTLQLIIIYWVSTKYHVLYQMLRLQWTMLLSPYIDGGFYSRKETDNNRVCLWWWGQQRAVCWRGTSYIYLISSILTFGNQSKW